MVPKEQKIQGLKPQSVAARGADFMVKDIWGTDPSLEMDDSEVLKSIAPGVQLLGFKARPRNLLPK